MVLNGDPGNAGSACRVRRAAGIRTSASAAGKGTISVKWKFGTQVIDEPSKQVDYDGPASTEFHLTNSGGFPPGDYSVDVFIDGVEVGTRAFKVGDFYS